MTSISTFTATIHVGLKHGPTGTDRSLAISILQRYVDAVGLCVSVKDVQYVYTGGSEPGLEVGLINYPRFPSSPPEIKARALEIAKVLLKVCHQERISVVMPDETVTLESRQ